MSWNIQPVIGNVYRVNHSRKGVFDIIVKNVSDNWVTGVIVQGKTRAASPDNIYEEGEAVTIRDSLCKLTLISGSEVQT